MSDGTDPSVSDHLRPTDADVPDGVYRVVGTADGVTLLRVGDADGRRVVTGEVRTVPDAAGFEAAENPGGNRSLARTLASVPRTVYWQLRVFSGSLLSHPAASVVAAAVLVAGAVGPEGVVGTLLVFAGAAGLGYVGSGQLDG